MSHSKEPTPCQRCGELVDRIPINIGDKEYNMASRYCDSCSKIVDKENRTTSQKPKATFSEFEAGGDADMVARGFFPHLLGVELEAPTPGNPDFTIIDGFPEDASFMFTGGTGAGKTTYATAIGRRFLQTGKTARFYYWPNMMKRVSQIFKQPGYQQASTIIATEMTAPHLLIVDDISSLRKGNQILDQILAEIVYSRSKKPTIYTTNRPAKTLVNLYGEAVVSRLLGATTEVRFNGFDWRKNRGMP